MVSLQLFSCAALLFTISVRSRPPIPLSVHGKNMYICGAHARMSSYRRLKVQQVTMVVDNLLRTDIVEEGDMD